MNRYYVEIKESNKNRSLYPCLMVDTGVRSIALSYDRAVIAELLDVSPRFLAEQTEGVVIEA